jgi:hypothetical protein
MDDVFLNIFVFAIVLVIYLHSYRHLKTSNDLEVYELDEVSKDRLDEILELLQPTIFETRIFDDNKYQLQQSYLLNQYHSFDINVRDLRESDPYIPVNCKTAMLLFTKDASSNYYTENNEEFLKETALIKTFQKNDTILRPAMVSHCLYDILMGSKTTCTPFRYHMNYRQFVGVTHGQITVRIAPPKMSKFLNPIHDYENFEFRTVFNPWEPHEKVKSMELVIPVGKMLFIPPYWWYSIRFDTEDTLAISCSYRTFMNNITISPFLFVSLLQNNNTKRIISKTIQAVDLLATKNLTSKNINININDTQTQTYFDFSKLKTLYA